MKQFGRIEHFCRILAAALFTMALISCSPAKGTDLEPRKEIFGMMQDNGFFFSRQLISTVYGENENQVIVSGRLARRTREDCIASRLYKITQYTKVIVEKEDGAWKIASATKYQR